MKIRTAQYIAKKQNGSYAVSAYRYKESFDSRSFQKGDLYCLLSLESEEDIQATTLAKFVWDGVLDAYTYSEAKTANEAITESLKMGEKKVRDLIKNDKELEESGVNLNFALVANKKEGFYVGVYGDMEVFVYREGSFVCISEVLKKNKAKTAGIILKKGEFLAISTPELFSAFVNSFDNSAGVDAIENALRSIEASLEGLEGIFTLRVEEDLEVKFDEIETKEEKKGEKERIVAEEKVLEEIDPQTRKKKLLKEITLNGKAGDILSKIKEILGIVGGFLKNISKKISFALLPLREKVGGELSKKKVFKKIGSRVSEIKFKKSKSKTQGFRIDGYKRKSLKKQRILTVGIAFIAIISIALIIQLIITKKHEKEIHAIGTEQMDNIGSHLSSASENIIKDKNEAEGSLYLAKEILDSLSTEISEEDLVRKAELLLEYQELEDLLLNRKVITDESLVKFLDTRLAFGEDSATTDIAFYKDTSENEYLYISDKGEKGVYRVAIYDKGVEKLPDNEGLLKSPEYIDYGHEGVYVYDSTQGVLKSSFSNGFNSSFESLTGVKARDLDDDSISEMAILTETDNIYLLSRNEGAILKSSRTGSGYGLTYAYIESESFSQANEFFSDFTIYIFRPGSDGLETYIYNYLTFKYEYSASTLVGLRNELENITKGYTSGSLDFGLYVFDANQKRFLDFEKPKEGLEELHPGELILKQQYIYRGKAKDMFTDVKDFVVDAEEKFMYILDGKTIWKVTL